MKTTRKRLLSLALVLLLIASLSAPAFAVAAPSFSFATGTRNFSLNSTRGKTIFTICIAQGNREFSIGGVRLSKGTSDASLDSYYSTSAGRSENTVLIGNTPSVTVGAGQYKLSYYVVVEASKSGTATLSYTVDGNTYTLKMVINPYKNRIKSIIINGVYANKSFANRTGSSAAATSVVALNKNIKNAVLRITPASTRILSVTVKDVTTGRTSTWQYGGNGVSSAALNIGALYMTHKYYITIVTTGNLTTRYSIRGINAN